MNIIDKWDRYKLLPKNNKKIWATILENMRLHNGKLYDLVQVAIRLGQDTDLDKLFTIKPLDFDDSC